MPEISSSFIISLSFSVSEKTGFTFKISKILTNINQIKLFFQKLNLLFKIDEKVSEEEKQLSKWLNRSEEALKIEFGKPDKIDFKNNSRNRFYVYTKEKLKIKCERIFEISSANKVVGFTSKNCF